MAHDLQLLLLGALIAIFVLMLAWPDIPRAANKAIFHRKKRNKGTAPTLNNDAEVNLGQIDTSNEVLFPPGEDGPGEAVPVGKLRQRLNDAEERYQNLKNLTPAEAGDMDLFGEQQDAQGAYMRAFYALHKKLPEGWT